LIANSREAELAPLIRALLWETVYAVLPPAKNLLLNVTS